MKKWFFATVSVIVVFTMLFMTACGNGEKTDLPQEDSTVNQVSETQLIEEADDSAITQVAQEEVSEILTDENSLSTLSESSTVIAPSTVEEIVEYFNNSANRIKPEAKKVVKNFEKRTVNEDKLDIPDAVSAPVKKGDVVGSVTFTLDGDEIGKADVVASEDVDKISFFEVWYRILAKFLLK